MSTVDLQESESDVSLCNKWGHRGGGDEGGSRGGIVEGGGLGGKLWTRK